MPISLVVIAYFIFEEEEEEVAYTQLSDIRT